jgi:hypothetical protein
LRTVATSKKTAKEKEKHRNTVTLSDHNTNGQWEVMKFTLIFFRTNEEVYDGSGEFFFCFEERSMEDSKWICGVEAVRF